MSCRCRCASVRRWPSPLTQDRHEHDRARRRGTSLDEGGVAALRGVTRMRR
jgi:hypothetical protein